MGYLMKLAYKNLARHKLRTAVSVAAVAFSVMIVVFARGYVMGLIEDASAADIQYNTGHIRIIDRDYRLKERMYSLNHPVENLSGMVNELEKTDGVEMVVPRLKFGAMSGTGDELVEMIGWGVRPEKESEFTRIGNMLAEGRMIENGRPEILMGTALLAKLDRKVGDRVTIMYNTAFQSLQATTFTIAGRIESNFKMLNEVAFYLPLDQAQTLLYMDDQATEILLAAPSMDNTEKLLPVVEEQLGGWGNGHKYLAVPWYESGALVEFMIVAQNIYDFIYVFLVILAAIVVINTMVMIVAERTKEIGMMSALGLDNRDILKLFVMEGAVMSIIGSFLGAGLGGITTKIFSKTGIDFGEALSGFSENIMVGNVIYFHHSFGNMVYAFIMGIVVVTLACIIPARRAARLNPTEALRKI